jgi:lysophospholipase L1-like esterase
MDDKYKAAINNIKNTETYQNASNKVRNAAHYTASKAADVVKKAASTTSGGKAVNIGKKVLDSNAGQNAIAGGNKVVSKIKNNMNIPEGTNKKFNVALGGAMTLKNNIDQNKELKANAKEAKEQIKDLKNAGEDIPNDLENQAKKPQNAAIKTGKQIGKSLIKKAIWRKIRIPVMVAICIFGVSLLFMSMTPAFMLDLTSGENAAANDANASSSTTGFATDAEVENALIYLGDSRTCGMQSALSGTNVKFICEVGSNYSWLVNGNSKFGNATSAESQLKEMLDSDSSRKVVVLAMGVNDLSNIDNYINAYNNLISTYPDIKFYFLSVNPVNDVLIDANGYNAHNDGIKTFNEKLKAAFSDNYIDAFTDNYEAINASNQTVTIDGLHYISTMYKKIHQIVVSKLKTVVKTVSGNKSILLIAGHSYSPYCSQSSRECREESSSDNAKLSYFEPDQTRILVKKIRDKLYLEGYSNDKVKIANELLGEDMTNLETSKANSKSLFVENTLQSEIFKSIDWGSFTYAIEIHFNAGGGAGTEIEKDPSYVAPSDNNIDSDLLNAITGVTGQKNRGINKQSLTNINLFNRVNVPFSYVEVEFYDNTSAMNSYTAKIDDVAEAIAKVIKKYYS